MVFCFTLNGKKVLAALQSFGSEFQIIAPWYSKLLCQISSSILKFDIQVGIPGVLFLTADAQIKDMV